MSDRPDIDPLPEIGDVVLPKRLTGEVPDRPDIDRLAAKAGEKLDRLVIRGVHGSNEATVNELRAALDGLVAHAKTANEFLRARTADVESLRIDRDRLADALRAATKDCTGARDCAASFHVHGCFNDYGDCDQPHEPHITWAALSAADRKEPPDDPQIFGPSRSFPRSGT